MSNANESKPAPAGDGTALVALEQARVSNLFGRQLSDLKLIAPFIQFFSHDEALSLTLPIFEHDAKEREAPIPLVYGILGYAGFKASEGDNFNQEELRAMRIMSHPATCGIVIDTTKLVIKVGRTSNFPSTNVVYPADQNLETGQVLAFIRQIKTAAASAGIEVKIPAIILAKGEPTITILPHDSAMIPTSISKADDDAPVEMMKKPDDFLQEIFGSNDEPLGVSTNAENFIAEKMKTAFGIVSVIESTAPELSLEQLMALKSFIESTARKIEVKIKFQQERVCKGWSAEAMLLRIRDDPLDSEEWEQGKNDINLQALASILHQHMKGDFSSQVPIYFSHSIQAIERELTILKAQSETLRGEILRGGDMIDLHTLPLEEAAIMQKKAKNAKDEFFKAELIHRLLDSETHGASSESEESPHANEAETVEQLFALVRKLREQEKMQQIEVTEENACSALNELWKTKQENFNKQRRQVVAKTKEAAELEAKVEKLEGSLKAQKLATKKAEELVHDSVARVTNAANSANADSATNWETTTEWDATTSWWPIAPENSSHWSPVKKEWA